LVSYNKEDILEEIGIAKEDLKDWKDNKEIINKLHTWVYRTAIKYKDYSELFKRIAEGKEYEDKSLWIKDYSDLELPEDEVFELKREALKVPLENYEKKEEDDLPRRVVNEKNNEYEEWEERKSFWQKVKSLFK
jgi:hypothetical protein